MTSPKSNDITLDLADAWALAEVLRHKAPCAADCEYCANTGGDRARVGYKLASKIQRALLALQAQNEGPGSHGKVTVEIDAQEAWMIYRYLPPTAYAGARALLMQVFKLLAGTSLEELSWLQDLNLDL